MERRNVPVTVVLSIGFLGCIILGGVLNVPAAFARWFVTGNEAIPLIPIARAIIYYLIPVLAVFDIVRRNSSGRYLGILSMLCAWAILLRGYVDLLFHIPNSRIAFLIPLVGFCLLGCIAALILSLGFNKKVDTYFSPQSAAE